MDTLSGDGDDVRDQLSKLPRLGLIFSMMIFKFDPRNTSVEEVMDMFRETWRCMNPSEASGLIVSYFLVKLSVISPLHVCV